MTSFDITILGSSSSIPTSTRNLPAQLLNVSERFFLIDCGEGTQIQLRRQRAKFQRINHIMISHLHGDHYFGLVGLITSMHLLGRTNDLHIYSPPGLKEIIDIQLKYSDSRLRYPLKYHLLQNESSEIIFEDAVLSVETIILDHRLPCFGFLFKEKPKLRNIKKGVIDRYNIPIPERPRIKKGEDLKTIDGRIIKNSELTTAPHELRSYAYCSDTAYNESIILLISGVNLLYHEATFMDDKVERAKETHHSTAVQAATIAKKAGVKQLIIGHFSARYKNLEPLLQEAKSVFKSTILAEEGKKFTID
ncbi:MAG: ribonuclease Z [Bacteroidota bacterium]